MVSLNWCFNQSKGIRIIEPNENISNSYLKLAENSLGTMNRERNKNNVFSISAGYYSIYYSLYSVLMRIGIKCEIHACTIKFMEEFLKDYYSEEYLKMINHAFKLRNLAQYYVEKVIDEKELGELIINAEEFYSKSKLIIESFNEDKVNQIRQKISKTFIN